MSYTKVVIIGFIIVVFLGLFAFTYQAPPADQTAEDIEKLKKDPSYVIPIFTKEKAELATKHLIKRGIAANDEYTINVMKSLGKAAMDQGADFEADQQEIFANLNPKIDEKSTTWSYVGDESIFEYDKKSGIIVELTFYDDRTNRELEILKAKQSYMAVIIETEQILTDENGVISCFAYDDICEPRSIEIYTEMKKNLSQEFLYATS